MSDSVSNNEAVVFLRADLFLAGLYAGEPVVAGGEVLAVVGSAVVPAASWTAVICNCCQFCCPAGRYKTSPRLPTAHTSSLFPSPTAKILLNLQAYSSRQLTAGRRL